MNRQFFFLLNLSLCFFIGCKSSIPMFTERTPTLLIGKIVFGGSDYVSRQGISFSGISTSGIEISFRNTVTNEVFRFSSDKNGLFYVNLQEGKYWIDELYIKKERNDGAWSDIYTNLPRKILEIERGKVNNIGTIHWTFVNRRHDVVQLDSSFDTKNEFAKQFPQSNWNMQEWIYNPWAFEVKETSDERISYYVKSYDGRDSTLLTLPKNIPDEIRRQIEKDMEKRMNDLLAQGDTTYYVKSENGLDSASLTIPKNMSETIRRDIEARMRQNMK